MNRIQCGLCHSLRQEFNLPAGLLAGWEGCFLLLLIHAQSQEMETQGATRCPASIWTRHYPIPQMDKAAQCVAAVMVWLFQAKLTDNIRDAGSQKEQILIRLFHRSFEKAKSILRQSGWPIQEIQELFDEQYSLEADKTIEDLADATLPFCKAVGLLTAHTSRIAGFSDNVPVLLDIGRLVGQLIAMLDACHDYERDFKRNQYNLIRAVVCRNEDASKISAQQFERVANHILINLQTVRSMAENVTLYRHDRLVLNILALGLYDSARQALDNLANSVLGSSVPMTVSSTCPLCGSQASSRFCCHCGSNTWLGSVQAPLVQPS
jgi:hypothetical protein